MDESGRKGYGKREREVEQGNQKSSGKQRKWKSPSLGVERDDSVIIRFVVNNDVRDGERREERARHQRDEKGLDATACCAFARLLRASLARANSPR